LTVSRRLCAEGRLSELVENDGPDTVLPKEHAASFAFRLNPIRVVFDPNHFPLSETIRQLHAASLSSLSAEYSHPQLLADG
jgi:hypothetical protein